MDFKNILVTGGSGTFGRGIISRLLRDHPDVERIVIYSRDELKQFEFQNELSPEYLERCRFFIGDVRDKDRVIRAMEDVECVIHAAAMKQVPASEYNPFECILTNIIGAQNIIDAALNANVKKIVALSTDKAAGPINLYGATKLCSDKLFIASNNIKGERNFSSSVVRYGNVFGSRGSVVPFFLKQKGDVLPITDKRMTRFTITLDQGIDLVLAAAGRNSGSDIVVPKIPSYRITDLAAATNPKASLDIIGIRPGEKLHEEMITDNDALSTLDMGDYYAIFPNGRHPNYLKFLDSGLGSPVPDNFNYRSDTNPEFLSVEKLADLIGELKQKATKID